MIKTFAKRLIVLLFIAAISTGIGFASDEQPIEKPIILKPVKGTDDPHAPEIPSFIKVTAAVDGDGVVITSNVDVVACVSIFDASTGQSYFSATTSIAPQCRCAIAPTDALLTLQITIGDIVYEGVFSLR